MQNGIHTPLMSPEAILIITLEVRPVLLQSGAEVRDTGRIVLRTIAKLGPSFNTKKRLY
jgi:hypothetical protein